MSADAQIANSVLETFPSIKVFQFENSLMNRQLDAFQARDRAGTITNRPFEGQSLCQRLVDLARNNRQQTIRWTEQTGIDLSLPTGAADLLLSYALAANHSGVVVCGMHQADHIARNATLADALPPNTAAFHQAADEIRHALHDMKSPIHA